MQNSPTQNYSNNQNYQFELFKSLIMIIKNSFISTNSFQLQLISGFGYRWTKRATSMPQDTVGARYFGGTRFVRMSYLKR